MFRFYLFLLLYAIGAGMYGQIRFAFLTDIHVVPGNEQEAALKLAVNDINNDDFDFVVVTGDLSNMGSDVELLNVKSILDKLSKPYYVIPGNHETNWSESAGLTFRKLWGNDRFSFGSGNYHFIGYSTGPYMKMGDGLVKNEDVIWLASELNKWHSKGKTIINLAHYPLTPDLSNYADIVNLLKESEVPLSLCGHGHTLHKMAFNGVTGIMGRALIGRDKSQGYNSVVFRNDSVIISEKIIGEIENIRFAFPLQKTDAGKVEPSVFQPHNIKTIWSYADSCSVMDGAAIAGNTVFIANSCGVIKCIDIRNNQLQWQFHTGEALYAKPFTDGKHLFVGTTNCGLIALNRKTGALEWEVRSESPVVAPGKVDGGDIFIGLGRDGFVCIDAASGKVKWSFSDYEGFIQAEPVVTDRYVITGAWDTNLYCLDRKSGKVVWRWNNGSPVRLLSPGNVTPAVAHNRVFLVAPDRYLTVLGLDDGRQIFRTKNHQVRESMGMTNDNRFVVAKTMNDSVIFVDTRSLEIKPVDCGFGYEHNPCPMVEIGGVVYGGTRQGVLFAIDSKTQKLLFSEKLGNSSISRIIDAGRGRVLVSLMEGRVILFRR